MLTIEAGRRIVAEARAIPALSRLGLVVMVGALALDVAIHLAADAHAAHGHEHLGPEHLAHLAGIVGMVLVLAGVVVYGTRRQLSRTRGAAKHGGLDPNALR
jgi:hypothetical protein